MSNSPTFSLPSIFNTIWTSRWAKPVIFGLCLLPLVVLLYWWQTENLGLNRVETVARFTGDWTLRMLVLSLCITPLRRLPGQASLIRFRRMIGLFAFFYGLLHMLHYYAIDVQWDWQIIREDLATRRFFIAGMVSFALLTILAATSFNGAIRRMGGKNWQRLHRLTYIAAIAGVVHFYWQGKAAIWTPVYWCAAVAFLLLLRVWFAMEKSRKKRLDN